ncbi:hypothetical protein EBT16_11275 [bacterium]|nr:hypothetical protein [bacterium]
MDYYEIKKKNPNQFYSDQRSYEFVSFYAKRLLDGYKLMGASSPQACLELHVEAQASRDPDFAFMVQRSDEIYLQSMQEYREAFEQRQIH